VKSRVIAIFSSSAVSLLGTCSSIPRDFPKTIEADLYPRRHPEAWTLLRSRLGKGSAFFRRNGYHIDCTDPFLATLPDGWIERLISFRTARTKGVTAWCLEAHDLFVSKLVAWRDKDVQYLRKMLAHRFVKAATIFARINDLSMDAGRKEELSGRAKRLLAEQRKPNPHTKRPKYRR